jgi:superfamily II DNA or RNA helicase
MTSTSALSIPRVGLLAQVRNRRGLVAAVDAFDTGSVGAGILHAVRIEYTDHNGPAAETLLWERETGCQIIEPKRLPDVDTLPPMAHREFDAVVRAARWSALQPMVATDGRVLNVNGSIAAPMFGAVQAEDFQLEPLLRALQMPRVSLLIADDVGLGKTVEAGLILTELLLRRRIRRVLVLCPASLKTQWQQEMDDKFSLHMEVIDRAETHALKRRLGMDANPWRMNQRIVASYHYLRQPDVLEQFLATCRSQDGAPTSAQLPWDLLVVDEAHNLMPSNFGRDSDLTEMLRQITPYFEHRLFLTATPHNGHTRCFSGLLELLDPVRFTQTPEFTTDEKARVEDVLVRRLKREINAMDDAAGLPARFSERFLQPVTLRLANGETALSAAFDKFRRAVRRLTADRSRGDQLAGSFAVEILNKRLLSCPYTFAESWWRFATGFKDPEQLNSDADVRAARRASEEDLDDDQEREGRVAHAAVTVGSWMRPLRERLEQEVAALDAAVRALGLIQVNDGVHYPHDDTRFEALVGLIREHLRAGNKWREDERLIVFTEYKTTLDYLEKRLAAEFGGGEWLTVLYGGLDPADRTRVKATFNDPLSSVRVMLATDTASEGLNLQETARYLVHYEIPWNPSRLEQRNGRLDRHGQARDVTIFHFTSDDDADLKFLKFVVEKVQEIRDDLGSMGEVFDAAVERRFLQQEDADGVQHQLGAAIDERRGQTQIPRRVANSATMRAGAEAAVDARRQADVVPASLAQTLGTAMRGVDGQEVLDGPDGARRYRLRASPGAWTAVIDDSLRMQDAVGALPALVFDPEAFVENLGGHPVFRPRKDARLMHLGHPLMRQVVYTLGRARFPSAGAERSGWTRWAVRRGQVPSGASALVLLTVEELGVNSLREPAHHCVRTLRLPVVGGKLQAPLAHVPPADDVDTRIGQVTELDIAMARRIWESIEFDVQTFQDRHGKQLGGWIRAAMVELHKTAKADAAEAFKARIREVERALSETSLDKIRRELEKLIKEQEKLRPRQTLFAEDEADRQRRLSDLADRQVILQEELERRQKRFHELLALLKREQSRVLTKLLPQRFELAGEARAFPVSVEIRLPSERGA